ncbi:MAG: protein jag [Chloroflexi bacterium]|nr:protein jag [Chloroflexota bacterium]
MRSVEAHGKTVEEAITQALQRLGRTRDEVEITVLSEGSRGVFGIGAELARVRVTVHEPEPAPATAGTAPVPLERLGETALNILTDLVELIGLEAEISVRSVDLDSDAPTVVLDVEGKDLGVLIGRRGETLQALQYVTMQLVQRKLRRWVRVTVDVAGYRDRQEAVLRAKALRTAERVQRAQTPIAMEPMRPNERRIVHLALSGHPTVTTYSIGLGDERRVVVSPRTAAPVTVRR